MSQAHIEMASPGYWTIVGLENPEIPKKQAFQSFVAAMDSIDIIVRLAFKDEDCVKVLIYLDGKQSECPTPNTH